MGETPVALDCFLRTNLWFIFEDIAGQGRDPFVLRARREEEKREGKKRGRGRGGRGRGGRGWEEKREEREGRKGDREKGEKGREKEGDLMSIHSKGSQWLT